MSTILIFDHQLNQGNYLNKIQKIQPKNGTKIKKNCNRYFQISISFCFSTCNRFVHIKKAIESIQKGIGEYSYEIIVADCGSTDGTIEYLKNQ